jgi:hypothetical protein
MKARDLVPEPPGHRPCATTLLGAAGMLGFVATLALSLLGFLTDRGFSLGVGASLATYGAALLLGHRGESSDAPVPAPARAPAPAPVPALTRARLHRLR